MTSDQRHEINLNSLYHPVSGDYWHEMLVGILIVLEVTETHVCVCKQKIDIDDNYWTFDLNYITKLTRDEFVEYLRYKRNPTRTWADVITDSQKYQVFVNDYLKLKYNNRVSVAVENSSVSEDITALDRIQNNIKSLIDIIETENRKINHFGLSSQLNDIKNSVNEMHVKINNLIRKISGPGF